MPAVTEGIDDIQFITNKSGEKTAIVISLADRDEDFRKLLTEYVQVGNFKDVNQLIGVEKAVQGLDTLIQKIKDPTTLKEVMNKIENLLIKIDEKIEDDFDLEVVAERADEETISHDDLMKELKADGLYKIQWKRSAVKELKQLSKETVGKILAVVENLPSNPLPHQTKKLVGSENSFRIRIGDYRVIYTVSSKILTVEIIRLGHRRDIYKR